MSRRNMDFSFVHEADPELAYKQASRQIAKSQPRFINKRSRGGPSRVQHQNARSDVYRKIQSSRTEAALNQEIRNKLLPGVKDGQSAAERLEAYNTERAITLTITTRAIGISSFYIFQSIYEFNNVPVRGNIYQLYRVALAAVESKLIVVNRDVRKIQDVTDDYLRLTMNNDMVIAAKAIVVMPDQLTSIINAIGHIKCYDKMFVPKIGRTRETRNDMFIPQSEQIVLTNLRATVVSLANNQTPVEFRQRFYNNNPIPGTRWRGAPENPVLLNADEIIPADYGVTELSNDIEAINAKMVFLNRKAPKYFTSPVSYEPGGSKAMLVCNNQNNMKVPDYVEGQEWPEYFSTPILGDIDQFYNLEHLSPGEQLDGNLCLLGESPVSQNHCYPVYLQRDIRVCCETSSLHFKSARNMKYT